MKIFLTLVYFTFLFYANLTFSHERQDLKTLQEQATGTLKNIIVHNEPNQVANSSVVSLDETSKQINFGQNRVTLINFWATWCAPCREEMPSLSQLVKNVASNDFSIIAIAVGRNSNDAINKFFLEHNLTNLGSYKDPKGKMSAKFSVLGLPTTVIIDQHSNELARLLGSTDWASDAAVGFINTILAHDSKLK